MDLCESVGEIKPELSTSSVLLRELGDPTEGTETTVRGWNGTTHGGRSLAHWTSKRRCSVNVYR